MRRVRASSFSARLKDCFLKTACATGPGKLHASSLGSGARNTSSGEPNSRSKRADRREASPGVSASASQEREASSSIARRAYARNNLVVKYQMRNLLPVPRDSGWQQHAAPLQRNSTGRRHGSQVRGILLQNGLERGYKQIGIGFGNNQRWAQLDHVVMRSVRSRENPAFA